MQLSALLYFPLSLPSFHARAHEARVVHHASVVADSEKGHPSPAAKGGGGKGSETTHSE